MNQNPFACYQEPFNIWNLFLAERSESEAGSNAVFEMINCCSLKW